MHVIFCSILQKDNIFGKSAKNAQGQLLPCPLQWQRFSRAALAPSLFSAAEKIFGYSVITDVMTLCCID